MKTVKKIGLKKKSATRAASGHIGGLYLYCIVEGGRDVHFGRIGLLGSEVYTIRCAGFLAVVHDCKEDRYRTEDAEALQSWVMTHNDVVNIAMEMFDAVLPLGFGKIIVGKGEEGPVETLARWLEKEREGFKLKLANVRGKEEYGVEILWDSGVVTSGLKTVLPQARELMEKAQSESVGTAYMYEEKLKMLLRREAEAARERYSEEFYGLIKKSVDGIKVDKRRQTGDKMPSLMRLSCLVRKDGVSALGEILERIKKEKGFPVRFTGPWPPYSFV